MKQHRVVGILRLLPFTLSVGFSISLVTFFFSMLSLFSPLLFLTLSTATYYLIEA